MSTKKTVQTERLRNIADGMRARGYIDSAFEVKHAADAIDELRGTRGLRPRALLQGLPTARGGADHDERVGMRGGRVVAIGTLKSCPFCGSMATIRCDIPRLHGYGYGVGCSNPNCIAYSGYGMMVCETKEEAVGAWNRRSEEQGKVDAMRRWGERHG